MSDLMSDVKHFGGRLVDDDPTMTMTAEGGQAVSAGGERPGSVGGQMKETRRRRSSLTKKNDFVQNYLDTLEQPDDVAAFGEDAEPLPKRPPRSDFEKGKTHIWQTF